jgi:YfiH family protein
MLNTMQTAPLTCEQLEFSERPSIRHGFFTRAGGVSEGIYASLNIGTGSADMADRVTENRARVAACIGVPADRLLTAYQIHSADAVIVDGPFDGDRPKADAVVTNRPGLAVAVSTADCGPVLFAEPHAGVVAAAHAGWKGALTGILENTVLAMERLGARRERVTAVLGPSISQANYEVGPEFVQRFVDEAKDNARWFAPSTRPGHALFDLNGFTLARLEAAGIAATCLQRCTYAEDDLFFSYRRTTHRGEPDYGRQISAIVLGDI